jgi:hypothetical protein
MRGTLKVNLCRIFTRRSEVRRGEAVSARGEARRGGFFENEPEVKRGTVSRGEAKSSHKILPRFGLCGEYDFDMTSKTAFDQQIFVFEN